MKRIIKTYSKFVVACLLMLLPLCVSAQSDTLAVDTLESGQALGKAPESAIKVDAEQPIMITDSIQLPAEAVKIVSNEISGVSRTKRAMWMALVFPGGGQIYNRKYWKLPLVYGGFVGCAYAWSWNNQMYQDYRRGFLLMYDKSVEEMQENGFFAMFPHYKNIITAGNLKTWQDRFSKRKDRFRRYRDMSFFCILGVYAISVIDAYVDASLSEFDISEDLSLHIGPTYINNNTYSNPLRNGGLGLQCSLNF